MFSEETTLPERTLIELLYGKGAHANPLACVEDLSADLAGRRVENLPHSVWQLVWHVNFWTDFELRRIHGEKPHYPEHATESWPRNPAPSSDTEWKKESARFAELIASLAAMAERDSSELSPKCRQCIQNKKRAHPRFSRPSGRRWPTTAITSAKSL